MLSIPVQSKKSVRAWYLYILQTNTGHLYTGISTNWRRRLKEHQENGSRTAKYLRGKGPLTICYCAELGSHSSALKAEIWVKKQTKTNKKKLIDNTLSLPLSHQTIVIDLHNQTSKK